MSFSSLPSQYRAQLVFETIPDKDVVSWNSLINGYSQQGFKCSSFVLELFQRMRAENTFPDSHTFAGVFNAASYVSDVFAGRQIHTLAIKTRLAGNALELFLLMRRNEEKDEEMNLL
ncbi:hypothetical protein M0R45_036448 [Rubus argutus]|uniref:Pentatricopeptide repeat-containing protein n=1 Tax=Rubus argutus TaxID=59490 RepID=A0AAW1VZW0_RUBAR